MELYFLEKTFSVPDDITTYWEAIRIAESQSEVLFHSFCDTLASSTESYLSDEKLYDYMKDCAGIFIKRLCEKGIYNKTTDDYVFNNPAFDDYKQINQLAKNTIEALELQSNANIADQSKIAEANAVSNITGSGVRVFTSSFLELAMGAAYESHQLNKQQAEAQQEYNNEVSKIIKRNTAILNNEVSEFIRDKYIPLMEKTLKIYVYNMADKYLEDLSHNNKFNKDTLKFTNISKSSSLLENLKYTDNKSAVLEEAFLACPFNIDVYFEAYKYANINKQTIETIKTMRLYYKFYNALFDKLKSIDVKKSLINALTDAEPLINILSLCDDTDKSTYYLTLIRPYVNDYARLKNFWSVSVESCKTSFTDFFEFPNTLTEEILKEFAENQVKSIISQSDFDLLALKPEIKFIERIAPDHFTEELTKDNIDKYYIEKIYGNLLLAWEDKIKEYNKAEKEKEIQLQNRLKALKFKKIIAVSILIFALILPVLINILVVYNYNLKVKAYITDTIEKCMRDSEISDELALTGEYKIEKIEYYQSNKYSFLEIVPTIRYYSVHNKYDEFILYRLSDIFNGVTSSYADDNEILSALPSSIGDSAFFDSITILVTKDGKEHFDTSAGFIDVENQHLSDGFNEFSPYLTSQFIIPYLIYDVVLLIAFYVFKKRNLSI